MKIKTRKKECIKMLLIFCFILLMEFLKFPLAIKQKECLKEETHFNQALAKVKEDAKGKYKNEMLINRTCYEFKKANYSAVRKIIYDISVMAIEYALILGVCFLATKAGNIWLFGVDLSQRPDFSHFSVALLIPTAYILVNSLRLIKAILKKEKGIVLVFLAILPIASGLIAIFGPVIMSLSFLIYKLLECLFVSGAEKIANTKTVNKEYKSVDISNLEDIKDVLASEKQT